ncbi:MAG: hypothetical protein ACYDH9_16035 [Limisphaerales bacterium]
MGDLLMPFRAISYYHPNQYGRASMKAVLPARTGRGYGHLASQEGGMASQVYLRVHFGEVPEAERQRVRRHLEEYCGLDTVGVVWIVEALGCSGIAALNFWPSQRLFDFSAFTEAWRSTHTSHLKRIAGWI